VPLIDDSGCKGSREESKLGATDRVHISLDLDRGCDEVIVRLNATDYLRLWCRIAKCSLRPVAKPVCQQRFDCICSFLLAISPSLLDDCDLFFVPF
jgi:hypothetical protein